MKPRIVEAINTQLQSKGLKLVDANADLGVSVHTSIREERSLEKIRGGFPGRGKTQPWGNPTATVETNRVGVILIDLFDTRTQKVAWWGSVSDDVSMKPEKSNKRLNKAIKQMFDKFPPPPPDRKPNGTESGRPATRPAPIIEEYWELAMER